MKILFSFLALYIPFISNAQTNEQQVSETTAIWKATILSNAQSMLQGEWKPGFALYHITVDSLSVPYLVYVPAAALQHKQKKLIVYLHGVAAHSIEFGDENPDLPGLEPVFSAADSLEAVVLYPFGRKDFGWTNKPAAFQNVLDITNKVIPLYYIDKKQIVMAGTSNGGTALFWYATQNNSPFRGYVAISAQPSLSIGRIEFEKLSARKRFYTVHAKDDEVYLYTDLFKTYVSHKKDVPGWHFETVESGNHGFIFKPGGNKILLQYLRKVFSVK